MFPDIYRYDDQPHRRLYYEHKRRFSISLPEGEYLAEFLSADLQETWPKFALSTWEGIPSCDGHLSPPNLTLVEPPAICNSLTLNEDMELGTYGWYHRSSSSDTKNGELVVAEGEGIDGSVALRYYNRTSNYHGAYTINIILFACDIDMYISHTTSFIPFLTGIL